MVGIQQLNEDFRGVKLIFIGVYIVSLRLISASLTIYSSLFSSSVLVLRVVPLRSGASIFSGNSQVISFGKGKSGVIWFVVFGDDLFI